MNTFLSCLVAPSSISKLFLLDRCCFYDQAENRLLRFMTTPQQPGLESEPLEALEVDCFVPSLASFFCGQQDDAEGWSSTTGSRLRSLSVSGVNCGGEAFLQTMAQNAHCVELQRVALSDLDVGNCLHLAKWICKTASLQELELENIWDLRLILSSLRSNGSIRTISIPGNKNESRLASSYCLRNQHIGELLGTLTLDETDQVQNATSSIYHSKHDHGSFSLYPTLLQCANQVSSTRTSTTLSTLMNLCDSIGF
jgi:hypothetical protein